MPSSNPSPESAHTPPGNELQNERPKIFLGGYAEAGLPDLKERAPELVTKIEKSHIGDSHLFTEGELARLRELLIVADKDGGHRHNLLSGYAQARWREDNRKRYYVTAFKEIPGQRTRYQENIAAMFWWRFTGKTEEERDMKRLEFYMNMSREEAEAYANAHLKRQDENFSYSIEVL